MRTCRITEIEIDVTPFDQSEAIKEYARRYLDDGYLGLSFDEAADQVASDLIDPSAAMRFKQEVRRMRRGK